MIQVRKLLQYVCLTMILAISINCSNQENRNSMTKMDNQLTVIIQRMDTAKLNRLSERKIFFGHQSVGYNIIDGIEDIKSQLGLSNLNILETNDPNSLDESGYFAHYKNGENRFPMKKVDDFITFINSKSDLSLDIAFFKFCYADFQLETDVESVFDYYVSNMDLLQKENPGIKIIHFTVPVKSKGNFIKQTIKKIFKKDKHAIRMEFNELMREKYADSLLFDLAYYESISVDNYSYHLKKDKTYLRKEYTTDGGHLNQKGSSWVAVHLLKYLSELDKD